MTWDMVGISKIWLVCNGTNMTDNKTPFDHVCIFESVLVVSFNLSSLLNGSQIS